MLNAVIFGAGTSGKNIYRQISDRYAIRGFVDDNRDKWNKPLFGLPVASPEIGLCGKDIDCVILASVLGFEPMTQKCLEMGFSERQIIKFYAEAPFESRRIFLKEFAETIYERGEAGACAEAGVFTGEFAKWINAYFPDRRLHLFDTFEGFDSRDIAVDGNLSDVGYRTTMTSVFSRTSEEMVLNKMLHPEMCAIHKGYFPESIVGKGLEAEQFCFVNLDMDLYQPTYAGLCFFFDKLTDHGIILVHDYFSDVFQGAKEAVDHFERENPARIRLAPIGDEFSMMVLKI